MKPVFATLPTRLGDLYVNIDRIVVLQPINQEDGLDSTYIHLAGAERLISDMPVDHIIGLIKNAMREA